MDAYQPIDCSLHDRFEAAAVRRQTVEIRWRDVGSDDASDGQPPERTSRGLIRDILVENGAEYLVMADGDRFRLDRIVEFRTV